MKITYSLILICLVFCFGCKKSQVKSNVDLVDTAKLFKPSYITSQTDTINGTIYIYGRNYEMFSSNITVKFNNTTVVPYGYKTGAILVKVPEGATTGPLYIEVYKKKIMLADTFYVLRNKYEWKRLSPFPGGKRSNAAAFVIGDKAYVGTGENYLEAPDFSDLWQYNYQNDTWIRKASVPEGAAAPFTGRQSAFSFSYGGKGYIGGGKQGYSFDLGDLNEYDPVADKWTTKLKLTGWVKFGPSRSCVVGTEGYVFSQTIQAYGGQVLYKYNVALNQLTRFDYAVGEFIPTAYNWYGVVNAKLLAGTDGGNFGTYSSAGEYSQISSNGPGELGVLKTAITYTNDLYESFGDEGCLWRYDFVQNRWTQLSNKKMGITAGITTFRIGSKIYVVGGDNGVTTKATDAVWMMDIDRYIR